MVMSRLENINIEETLVLLESRNYTDNEETIKCTMSSCWVYRTVSDNELNTQFTSKCG